MDDIVLWVESAGLGDHLIYSTLPELFARRGHHVYVSNAITTRNDEVRNLLYHDNPFVSGWTDAPANAGTGRPVSPLRGIRMASMIGWIELGHGLPVTSGYPRIYYKPRFMSELSKMVLVDPRSTSQMFPRDRFEAFVGRLGFAAEQLLVVSSKHSGPYGIATLPQCRHAWVTSLHEYIDMIYSCSAYVGTESGGTALASAIRQGGNDPEIYALATTKTWNDRVYVFPNVSYTILGGLQDDW